jgi:hypothetical protein
MTDTMTIATAPVEVEPIEAQPRPAMIGVLARAEAAEQAALARVADLQAEVDRLRSEQITDGGDPRLEAFWDKAGRIADHADFCDEYDRLADAMNGTVRTRDWDVALDITISVRVYMTVEARGEDDATDTAESLIDADNVIEALRDNGWNSISFDDTEASRS